jgi:hypothetical protein
MSTNLKFFAELLDKVFSDMPVNAKGGKPVTYTHTSFVLFFMVVLYKRIFAFKSMHKYAKVHYANFGFTQIPSRRTIKRRFVQLPQILLYAIPRLAKESLKYCYKTFHFRHAFVDKSVFCSLGGIWHKKHILLGVVPHFSIDVQASWAKSAYHKWRFGYGLHLIVNENRFPISACVSTACVKDHTMLTTLLTPVHQYIGILVGDNGYFAHKTLKAIYQKWAILIHTPSCFQNVKNTAANWFKITYNEYVKQALARLLYSKRRGAVEPVFALIKEIFDLEASKQLPFKTQKMVEPFMLNSVITIQLIMIENCLEKRKLSNTEAFFTRFR